MFTVCVKERTLNNVEFIVIEGQGLALLGRATAIALGVLKLEAEVNSVQNKSSKEHDISYIFDN